MHYLLRHAAAHRGLLAAGLVLALLGSAAGLAQPLAAQSVIDSLGGGGSLLVPVVLLSLLVLGSAVANGVNSYLLDRTGEHVVLSIRRRLAARLVRIRVPELDTRAPGDLVTRATSDTGLVRHATISAPVTLVNGAVGMVGALVLMAVLDLRLFGVTVAVLVVVGAPAALVLPRIRRATEQAQSAVGTVGSVLDRVLGAARTVKAYGAERREQAAVDDAATAAFRAGVVQARWEALLVAGAEFALQASFLVVLAVGGGLVGPARSRCPRWSRSCCTCSTWPRR
ncbi:ABC transporter transmembrane domain-containing protein [Pseudonocardia sp. ICBG601]|uniref:ABC transporter transmembrane domain-containing protein n=1 Tax=Pseudonocardia sp. ICBG601 TaxID=2846759 RepID=UPI001CF6EBED|nr:ABC transporter transmembrane domain-containing protein [Pseudonocardia sp. ICBG601]